MKTFIRFPDQLYKGCGYYIPALHSNQEATLSKEKNPAFEHCEARYWLAYKGKEIVGRVAGIINHRYNQERNTKFMRIGWLDFVEDQQVLEILLGAVEDWAHEKGMDAIHGPLGFTSFDASGVLIEGFEEWPTSFGKYNYAYYDAMLQKAGFKKDVDWVEFSIKVPEQLTPRVLAVTEMIKKRYALRNALLRNQKEVRELAPQIFDLLNNVYNDLYGFSTLTPAQVENLTREFLSLIHPDYVSLILNEHDEIVAFGVVMPSLTKALKKANGRLFPFGFLRLLYALRFNDTVDMLLIGVRPDYQGKGVHALVFEKIVKTFHRRGIKRVETTRELEENHKVQQLWTGYESRLHKRARCYIKEVRRKK
ncbi:MAG: GNAT family N-acetyltransferase [Bacteroidales bacterium]|nr:GNAT family N-acetyltransferase [Bacteroidales bacterium]